VLGLAAASEQALEEREGTTSGRGDDLTTVGVLDYPLAALGR
jgi:hypothetical protein